MFGSRCEITLTPNGDSCFVSTREPSELGEAKAGVVGGKGAEYESIKKRMKEHFKLIFEAIHRDLFPLSRVVEVFLETGRAMAAYPGKGDEHYPRFMDACNDLSEALAEKNMAQLRMVVDDLNHMKTECHARYK
ncbi:MAG: GAK system XXXCH domain-containing protein [Pseudodesulfovibrio sp.]|nr:GAK system XXXCH domain-containing protein [Pseudodesulfovibrio sp.]